MAGHAHRAVRSETRPYLGPVVSGDDQNPAAHGGVCEVEFCSCGARRRANLNGGHVEQGEWDLPEWVADANPSAIAFRADDARRLLAALADSAAGRDAIERAGYGVILESPDKGDDAGSLLVARAAVRALREVAS